MESLLADFRDERARAVREEILASQVGEGVFSADEVAAMQQPGSTITSWLPPNEKRPGHTLLLLEAGVVIGVADLFGGDARGECVLENYAIATSYQGRGHSRELWRAVQEDARRNAMSTIIIFSLTVDKRATQYWRHVLNLDPTQNGWMTCAGKRFEAVGWRYQL